MHHIKILFDEFVIGRSLLLNSSQEYNIDYEETIILVAHLYYVALSSQSCLVAKVLLALVNSKSFDCILCQQGEQLND